MIDNIITQDEIVALLNGECPQTPSEGKESRRTPRLYHWYLEKATSDDGTECALAHGNVTGHKRIADTTFINTSKVENIEVREETEEVIIRTMNTEYHCRLSDCDYSRPDTYDLIPGLSEHAAKYEKGKEYQQDDNTILLVLSDHESYYFETMLIKENGNTHRGEMHPHIGTFQDSCLIRCAGYEQSIDIRYFPHHRHLETYAWEAGQFPVYLENSGEDMIYYTTNEGVIELKPGERKLVSKENASAADDIPFLDRSDLYPAVHIDGDILM